MVKKLEGYPPISEMFSRLVQQWPPMSGGGLVRSNPIPDLFEREMDLPPQPIQLGISESNGPIAALGEFLQQDLGVLPGS